MKETPIVIVVAAGNCGNGSISSTAKLVDKVDFLRKRILSIGALDCDHKIAHYSPEQYVSIYQPCEFLAPVLDPKGDDTLLKPTAGTSMSTPAVAGIICLLIQCWKKHNISELSKLEIINLLKNAIKHNTDKKEIGTYNEAFLKSVFNDKEAFERGCVQLVNN